MLQDDGSSNESSTTCGSVQTLSDSLAAAAICSRCVAALKSSQSRPSASFEHADFNSCTASALRPCACQSQPRLVAARNCSERQPCTIESSSAAVRHACASLATSSDGGPPAR